MQLKRDVNGPLGSVLNENMYADAMVEEQRANGGVLVSRTSVSKDEVCLFVYTM